MQYKPRLTFWTGLLLAIALFVPVVLALPRQALFGIEDSAIICVALAIATVCFRGVRRALWRPFDRVNRGQSLLSGLFLTSIALVMVFCGQWYWRLSQKPNWIADSVPVAFSRWLLLVALIIALAGVWSTQSTVISGGAYQRSAIILAGSLFLAALVIIGASIGF